MAELPLHIVAEFTVTVGVGIGATATVPVVAQLLLSLIVTV
jgi:hypothetical protein